MRTSSVVSSVSGISRRQWLLGSVAAGLGCRGLEPPAESTGNKKTDEVEPAGLSVLTYNVLADRVGVRQRIPVLLDLMDQARADVLALQEVADWFLGPLHEQGWTRGLHACTFEGRRAAPGGQYILSRHPILDSRALVLPGRQRRTVVISRVEVAGAPVDVATTHMESFLEDGPTRALQLDAIFAELSGSGDAILAGDFNFGDGEPESAHLDPAFTDAWTHLYPNDPGFTWNIERSQMARAGSFEGEESRRLDRILVRSRRWIPAEARIIGDHPVEVGRGELFPSDHFGLVARLVERS